MTQPLSKQLYTDVVVPIELHVAFLLDLGLHVIQSLARLSVRIKEYFLTVTFNFCNIKVSQFCNFCVSKCQEVKLSFDPNFMK